MGKISEPFNIIQHESTATVLILGDSTAYGTGARFSKNSIAGRLATDYPNVSIENQADNGAKTFDVAQKALRLEHTSFDIVIVQVGGNDILSYIPINHILNNLKTIVTLSKKIARKHVILVAPMNVSSSPLFWFPFNVLYGARSRMVRNAFHKVSNTSKVTLVDLYVPRYRDPFREENFPYFAKDLVHPNDKGYGLIYEKIKEITNAYHVLGPAFLPMPKVRSRTRVHKDLVKSGTV
jgi:lysophospholipase L1-like esterase